jgi:UDP-N-acetylmuramate dehydrogenase
MSSSIESELRTACSCLKTQEPLSRHTSLAVGGPADFYADVNTLSELISLRRITDAHHLPVFFLGAGSNVLVSDRGVRGLVVHLQGDFRLMTFNGTRVKVGAGVMMPTLAKQAAEHGLSGVESLIGVPGTIGGGLVMNAGTREGWLGNVVVSVEVLGDSLQAETFMPAALAFTYRHSNLEGRWIVGGELELKADEPASIMKRMDALLQYRTRTQPLTTANCGSVFKNPPDSSAAQWIEKAGFKGMQVGGARVSERHANFIINERAASANDVREIIQRIQKKVQEEFNVRLEAEVKMVGE